MEACKKLQRYRSTTDTFADKVRRDFACPMLLGPCPAVKHIWPHTRLQHARENVAAYLCSYRNKQPSSISTPPRSASESKQTQGCPYGQSQPKALWQEPRHPGILQHASDCPKRSTSTALKISKEATHYIPPPPPSPCLPSYFPQLWNIFSLVASHVVSDMERIPSGSCFRSSALHTNLRAVLLPVQGKQ